MKTIIYSRVKFHHLLTLIERDETKGTKLWRRKQGFRVFKASMIYYASFGQSWYRYPDPHWFELAKTHWAQVYRSTGTPCRCWLCRGIEYDRLEYKRETRRIIRESMESE